MRIDREALEEESLEPDATNITILTKEISYRAGLSQVLSPQGLVAIVDRSVLTITTSTVAEETLVTRMYTVADLIRSSLGPHFSELKQLEECISSTVVPDSWDDVGGPGTIAHYKGALTISNTLEAHRDIAGLLNALRKFPANRTKKVATTITSTNSESADIGKAMQSLVDAKFEKKSLLEAVDSLLSEAKVAYFYHHSVIENGTEPEFDRLTEEFREVPLGQILSLMLDEFGLAWTYSDESVAIMTQEAAEQLHQTQVFDVSRLIDDRLTDSSWADSEASQLGNAITDVVSPNSWENVGGLGAVEYLPNRCVLVISNTAEILNEVEAQLDMMEQARKAAYAKPKAEPSPSDVVKRIYTLAGQFRKSEQAGNAIVQIRAMLRGTDNALDEPYTLNKLGDKLILSHRRDVQPTLAMMLHKLGVIFEPECGIRHVGF